MIGTIVFDLDGTLALGTGPIVAYARAIDERAGGGFLARALAELDAFESGGSAHRDGYHAVAAVARADGIPSEVGQAAYVASRHSLETTDAGIEPPAGLGPFLTRVSTVARIVLATNAPEPGVPQMLESWGVAALFSAMHFSVGKPAGLERVVREALVHGPVLSIGDIAEFDLAPAAALGADTALVGVTAPTSPYAATMRGRTVADLYADIEAWAEAASGATSP